jgi:hypothetical protein
MAANRRLRELLDEAGCDQAQLARWVNAVGEERGQRVTYGKSAVTRWLQGAAPRWPTPSLVADALTRRLGYEVTVTELGWKDQGVPPSGTAHGTTLEKTAPRRLRAVAELAGKDLDRRAFLRGAAFVAGAFAGPALLAATVPASLPVAAAGGRRFSAGDVGAIRATVSHFRGLEQRLGGGGRLRMQVVRYLQGEASAALDGSFTTTVGQRLYAAVAELSRLAGYMSFDSGRHALAQRYYIQSLGLAHAAGDPVETAITMSCMSFQAVHLREGQEAVAIARAAMLDRSGLSLGLRSMLHAIEARGLALLGEEAACSIALGAAESELGRSEPECEPDWLRYFGPAELSAHAANCMRDLGHPAASLAHARDAYAGFPESAVRSRGFIRTGEAIALLDERDVEAACVAASDALDIAGRVRSARSRELLSDFQTRLRSDAAVPVARELLDRIGRHPEARQREHGEAHSGENHGVARAGPLATADQQHAGRRTGAARCREHADQPATADRPRRHRLNHGRQ